MKVNRKIVFRIIETINDVAKLISDMSCSLKADNIRQMFESEFMKFFKSKRDNLPKNQIYKFFKQIETKA